MIVCLHAVEYASRANGPGLRAVIWFQGCTLGCPSCFNPDTHAEHGGFEADTEVLASELLRRGQQIEGVSFSGGEPFQQPEGFLHLLERLAGSPLGKLAFSGYTEREIRALPLGPAILHHLDVLIAGRYVRSKHLGRQLLGSSNQQVHLLSERYSPADFQRVPGGEVILRRDGTIIASGISPWHPIQG